MQNDETPSFFWSTLRFGFYIVLAGLAPIVLSFIGYLIGWDDLYLGFGFIAYFFSFGSIFIGLLLIVGTIIVEFTKYLLKRVR